MENDGECYLQGFLEGRFSSLTTLMLSPSLVVILFSAPGNQAKKILLEVHPCGTELPAYSSHNSVHRLFKIFILKSFNVFNTYKNPYSIETNYF